jgi:hypothetical protein
MANKVETNIISSIAYGILIPGFDKAGKFSELYKDLWTYSTGNRFILNSPKLEDEDYLSIANVLNLRFITFNGKYNKGCVLCIDESIKQSNYSGFFAIPDTKVGNAWGDRIDVALKITHTKPTYNVRKQGSDTHYPETPKWYIWGETHIYESGD